MDFGISTYAFGNEPLSPAILDRLLAAGFSQIELFANRPHFDFHNRGLQRDLAAWFESSDVGPPSLHLPYFERAGIANLRPISALEESELDRVRAIDEIKRALEFTDRLPVSHLVTHLGVPNQRFGPLLFEYAYTLLRNISDFTNVKILIENIPNDISTPERIQEFLAMVRLPDVRICYDSGHGSLQGSPPFLDSVDAIHLNDNQADGDDHLWPFEGGLNWSDLIVELVEAEFHGPIVFEVADPHIERGLKVSERLEALFGEARSSPAAFRRRYSLKEDTDDKHLH